jgi:UDP-N-acetylmuramoyl-tripeptide--D-alanyl-D-alanine ligase
MNFLLSEVAAAMGAPDPGLPQADVGGWSVDSRSVAPGDLFFALKGPNHDGHDYVPEVLQKGAAAAVVDRAVSGEGVLLRVNDTLQALQTLAGWARARWAGRLVAVTGSSGKTTTKEVIAALLGSAMPVGKSSGNLNNHVGLPLSILRLAPETRAAVVEMGMNHAGEIRELAAVAKPDVGVVTNIGHAHAGFFASIDELALAKRELIESLAPDGVAVLNADDPRVARFRECHPGRSVTFGLSPSADVRAEEVELSPGGSRFRLVVRSRSLPAAVPCDPHGTEPRAPGTVNESPTGETACPTRTEVVGFQCGTDAFVCQPGIPGGSFTVPPASGGGSLWFETPLEGTHGVLNLLAGIAVAGVFGIDAARLTEAASTLHAGEMRGRRFNHQGVTILDDCYNSNPEAARRMLDLLGIQPARRRLAVLGEMLELGRWSEDLHRDVGRHVARCGIHLLIGIRGAASHIVDEAVSAGMSRGAAFFFEDPAEAGEFLRGQAGEGDAVLFKGSRGVHVEIALESFLK